MIKHLLNYLGGRPLPKDTLPIIIAGFISALLAIIFSISFAGLLFNGALFSYLPLGIGLALVGTLVLTLSIPLTSTYRGTVGGLIAEPAIVLGLIATSLATRLEGQTLIATILAAVMVAGLSTGLGLYLLARFKLGQIGQYVPYPVIGGFLAGLGIILCQSAFSFVLPFQFGLANLESLRNPQLWPSLVLVVSVGTLLWLAQRFRPSAYNIPVILAGVIALFWLIMFAGGETQADIRQANWLLGAFPEGGIWSPDIPLDAIRLASWENLLLEAPKFLIIFLLVMISALMDASSLELAIKQDIDPNRELKAAGLSNMLCGVLGGFLGTASISATKINANLGAHFRYVGLVATLVVLAVLSVGADAIAYMPKFAVAGLLFYIGIEFMREWLVDTWQRVSPTDYLTIAVVFLMVAGVGFMEGFVTGLAMGLVFFIAAYSRLPVVKFISDGQSHFSNVNRTEADHDQLRINGESVYIMKLQGFIFFGTARKLVEDIRARLGQTELNPVTHLLLDFEFVTGLDSSAMTAFQKVRQYADSHHFSIILCHGSDSIIKSWHKSGLLEPGDTSLTQAPDLDIALEQIEEHRLKQHHLDTQITAKTIDPLAALFNTPKSLEIFLLYCQVDQFSNNDYLCRQGDDSQAMFLIKQGQVSVYLEKSSGERLRLRKYLYGSIVGHIAMLLGTPRTASVIADNDVVAYTLDKESMLRMRQENPDILIEFQTALLKMTAVNLQDSNRLISELGA
jgi:SulP family sulfate permease